MNDFARLLEAEIPRLRRYARALTRDVARADDLVQSCLTRAVAKQHLWQPGTDLRAWLFTILHNQHVNYVRRSSREGVSVEVEQVATVLPIESNAIPSLELRDLRTALAKLPIEQRETILLVGLEGMDYEGTARVLIWLRPSIEDAHHALGRCSAWPRLGNKRADLRATKGRCGCGSRNGAHFSSF